MVKKQTEKLDKLKSQIETSVKDIYDILPKVYYYKSPPFHRQEAHQYLAETQALHFA